MYLKTITLQNFRNIADSSLEFSQGINCITGNNGAGKTNMLDAIYYLSMTKSYFSTSDQYIFRFGEDEAVLSALYQMDDECQERISASIRKDGKSFRRGSKAYQRFSDHIGLIPVVMVSPSDTALVNDSGEERRKYLNSILSQTDRNYLRHIQSYNQLLLQRNKLLKSDTFNHLLLETFDERMQPHAEYVYESRKNLCEKLKPIISHLYSLLSQDAETVSLELRSDLDDSSLTDLLARERERDIILRYTGRGIQRDDVLFSLDAHPLRKCASQGQQKTFLLAMKLAQMDFMKESYGHTPILLLDDVFDKLDMNRVGRLISIVSSNDYGQIFITDSNKVRIDSIVGSISSGCAHFSVDNGCYTAL